MDNLNADIETDLDVPSSYRLTAEASAFVSCNTQYDSRISATSISTTSIPRSSIREDTVSALVCSKIVKEGVDSVFLVPGGFVDNLCNAIADSPDINAFVAASEGGAAMMADGYARVSGRFGVCIAIAGPGASNMITGLSLSNIDKLPVLAITGESPSDWRNRDSIQDCGTQGLNTTQLLGLIAKSQYQISEPKLASHYLKRCMQGLNDLSSGVFHLSLPMEQQAKKVQYSTSDIVTSQQKTSAFIDEEALTRAKLILDHSVRTVVLIGAGLRKSKAFGELMEFVERYSLPVATTMDAKGDFPEDHPLSLGVFGWAGSRRANEIITGDNVDCLFMLGGKLGQVDTMGWSDKLIQNRKLIHLSRNSADLDTNYEADCSVFSDEAAALKFLTNDRIASTDIETQVYRLRKEWLKDQVNKIPYLYDYASESSESAPIHPARVIQKAQEALPLDSRVFVDNGAHTFFATHYWLATEPNSFFSAIKYSGAMGWAVPASIGAHIAKPAPKTLVFVGDGCMLMHGIEVQTAVKYGLKNIIFVVLNNKAHGNPKLRSLEMSKGVNAITDIVDHDWSKFAQSLGLKGMTVDREEDLGTSFTEAAQTDEPILIDVKCGLYPTPTKIFDELFMSDFNKNTIDQQ